MKRKLGLGLMLLSINSAAGVGYVCSSPDANRDVIIWQGSEKYQWSYVGDHDLDLSRLEHSHEMEYYRRADIDFFHTSDFRGPNIFVHDDGSAVFSELLMTEKNITTDWTCVKQGEEDG